MSTTGQPPVRPPAPTAQGRPTTKRKRRESRTVTTERSLEALCQEQARERLGKDAPRTEVARLAKRLYEGGRAVPEATETPVQRWNRERQARQTREDLARRR